MGIVLLVLPILAVLLFLLFKGKKPLHAVSVSVSVLLAAVAVVVTRDVMVSGEVAYSWLGGLFYVDSLSIIVLDIVLAIGLLTSIYSVGYMNEEMRHGRIDGAKLRLYYILMYSFMFTMVLALTVRNMGIMWVAIEATTLTSVFLVGFYNDKFSLEAAWKYVIICSVGIAVALLGISFLHLSSIGVVPNGNFLDWTALYDNAKSLDSSIAKLAFIFILVGFGTKAGLAPMHTWLPDAHSQAPSPISALLSGVLLNSAMYGIIRTVSIVNRNLGSSVFTGRILIAVGVLSILTAAVFILTQKDYKRLLAYSSIEHMGIIAVAIGMFTPLSIYGALLHMINHSLTKAMLFLTSGNILQKYDTKEMIKVRGLLKLLPVSGTVFLLGLLAITGTPPFSIFGSELSIVASAFQSGRYILGILFLSLLAVVFAGITITLFKMFHGNDFRQDLAPGETNIPGTVSIVALLVVIILSGLFIPDGINRIIRQAQQIIIGA